MFWDVLFFFLVPSDILVVYLTFVSAIRGHVSLGKDRETGPEFPGLTSGTTHLTHAASFSEVWQDLCKTQGSLKDHMQVIQDPELFSLASSLVSSSRRHCCLLPHFWSRIISVLQDSGFINQSGEDPVVLESATDNATASACRVSGPMMGRVLVLGTSTSSHSARVNR